MNQTPVLLQSDFYKQGHYKMAPKKHTKAYSNCTPRKSRIEGINKIVVLGFQYWIKEYVIDQWNENFFSRNFEEVGSEYKDFINATLGPGIVELEHIQALHTLGHMPLEIKVLPEGSLCPIRVPCMTITNTVDHAAWLVNFLETIMSNTVWQPMTSATLALEYKKIFTKFALETVGDTNFVPFSGHDFAMRGLSSLETSCTSGFGHLTSFVGTDTIPAIIFAQRYYNADIKKELVGTSVYASEHAIAALNIAFDCVPYENSLREFIERTPSDRPKPKIEEIDPKLIREYAFLKRYITEIVPNGIASYVADTYNIFSVVAEILPRLKPEIMSRSGGYPVDRLVIRPDSFWTDPVDCLCGFDGYHPQMEKLTPLEIQVVKQGLVESLWNIFGGTKTEKGYKLLDSHIGDLYGDSISIERAFKICQKLKDKGFASTNWLGGIGSYTYQFNTRDTFGFAVKSTYGEVTVDNVVHKMEIYKDPISDDGMKKSATGLLRVDLVNGEYILKDQCTPEEEAGGELKTVFKDGKLLIETSLREIRARIAANL